MEVCILNTKNLMMAQVAVSKLESQGIFCDYSILDYSLVLRSDPCFSVQVLLLDFGGRCKFHDEWDKEALIGVLFNPDMQHWML